MTIEGINVLRGSMKAENDKVSKRQSKASSTEAKSTGASQDDSVHVGGKTEVALFKAEINQIPDVRSDKIEELQEAIADGTYKVPSKALASIILGELA